MTNISRREALVGLAATTVLPTVTQSNGLTRVGMQLALAVDMSLSVDDKRYKLQLSGYLAALQDKRVLLAIRELDPPTLGLLFVAWAQTPAIMVPWTLITDKESMSIFCKTLQEIERPKNIGIWTRIDVALPFCASQFDRIFVGGRKVIDISGDGGNSFSETGTGWLRKARDEVVSAGVTINGLPILVKPPDTITTAQPPEGLDVYYRNHVIGGPGKIMVSSEGFDGFYNAILTKLVREIA